MIEAGWKTLTDDRPQAQPHCIVPLVGSELLEVVGEISEKLEGQLPGDSHVDELLQQSDKSETSRGIVRRRGDLLADEGGDEDA